MALRHDFESGTWIEGQKARALHPDGKLKVVQLGAQTCQAFRNARSGKHTGFLSLDDDTLHYQCDHGCKVCYFQN